MRYCLGFLYLTMALLLVQSGCYGRKLVNVPNTVDQTRGQVEELRKNQEETLRLVRELEARLDENTEFLRQLRADTGSRFEELAQGVGVLGGKVDENAERFSRLSEKVDEVKYSPKAQADTLEASGDTLAIAYPEAAKAYRDAYLDITAGKYELARMGFEEFLKSFPESELADNAQYWIGESYYAQEQYGEAYEAFKKVLDNYPEGDKIPSALLKVAYCSLALDKKEEGRKYLEELISRFPLSEEARLAQEKMESLSGR
ncbi:MAG: tol-pal system protein YbgF [Candidatus Eisenbacteria bacterium]|nr:tol-pal system protein YbgF [Candidatus Eisenbacteria bacterium]